MEKRKRKMKCQPHPTSQLLPPKPSSSCPTWIPFPTLLAPLQGAPPHPSPTPPPDSHCQPLMLWHHHDPWNFVKTNKILQYNEEKELSLKNFFNNIHKKHLNSMRLNAGKPDPLSERLMAELNKKITWKCES